MAFSLPRESRPFVVLAVASLGLAACSSGTPTAPSSLSASPAAAHAGAASGSSASLGTDVAEVTRADTLRITQGTLAVESLRSGSVALKGSHGFRFDGRITSGLEPFGACAVWAPCPPGTTVSFRPSWLGTDLSGTGRVQGQEFELQGAVGPQLFIELTGSFVAPAELTDTATVTLPFTATVLLFRGEPYPDLQLIGRGLATLTLERSVFGGWSVRYSSFDFGGGPPH